jgi:hypothetical protein
MKAGKPKELFSDVPQLCPGGTVVCLAGGPSLTQADVDYCRGKATVIAINDAYRLAPWADVLYACDKRWWDWHKGVGSFKGLKYALQRPALKWPGVQILQNTGPHGLELKRNAVRNGKNSGYQAMNVAVHLGAKRIVLLGYDMHIPQGGPSHWFGEHPLGGPPPVRPVPRVGEAAAGAGHRGGQLFARDGVGRLPASAVGVGAVDAERASADVRGAGEAARMGGWRRVGRG